MKKKKLFKIIPIILIVLLIVVAIYFINKDDKSENKQKGQYKWKFYKSDQLPEGFYKSKLENIKKNNRCIDDACIDDVVIIFNKSFGSISYKFSNNTKHTLRKKYYYLKLSNGDKLLIYIKKLKKGKTYNGKIYFNEKNMYNVNNYKLVNLTKKELKNVK